MLVSHSWGWQGISGRGGGGENLQEEGQMVWKNEGDCCKKRQSRQSTSSAGEDRGSPLEGAGRLEV
jgi:hypothetical protein